MKNKLDNNKRSKNMSRIRSKDTAPELRVRSALHRLGYRFRLHRRDLPGTPDIVLPRLSAVVFVNGCFWHRHPDCKYAYTPKSRTDFWQKKFDENVRRDALVLRKLEALGWQSIIVWECETKDQDELAGLLNAKLCEVDDCASPTAPD